MSCPPFFAAFALIGEMVFLKGTDSVPITAAQVSITPADAEVVWAFCGANSGTQVKGQVMYDERNAGDAATFTKSHDLVLPNDFNVTYYIKATQTGVTTPGTAPNLVGSDSLDTWLSLIPGTDVRSWGWTHTTGLGTTEGEIKVDIATDSGGSQIIATGFYKGTATVSS